MMRVNFYVLESGIFMHFLASQSAAVLLRVTTILGPPHMNPPSGPQYGPPIFFAYFGKKNKDGFPLDFWKIGKPA